MRDSAQLNLGICWQGLGSPSESAAAIFLRRALPAARQKTARPFLILIWALQRKERKERREGNGMKGRGMDLLHYRFST